MPVNYMPGDTTALVKAELAATEGSKTKVTVYFNPKEITVDKPVQWQVHKGSESDAPTLEFTSGQPRSFACELMFDMFEDKGDVYATYVSKLEKLALIDDSLKRPPLCTFTWGNNMPVFKGVVEDLNVKYTLFLPDGTPCRATVNLKMKQSSHLLNKKEAEKANKDREKAEAAAAKKSDGTPTANSTSSPQESRARDNAAGVDNPASVPPGTSVPSRAPRRRR
jgi:hypothetical protein